MNERQLVETRLVALAARCVVTGPSAVMWPSLFVDASTWTTVEDDLPCRAPTCWPPSGSMNLWTGSATRWVGTSA
ncbi:MAG: hypothetical protein K0R13_2663 [Propionibacteriaceae bacterium]|jgi:hypothetical protein|nr:hypothetical protein [Propionibacteriaceae bacterium]